MSRMSDEAIRAYLSTSPFAEEDDFAQQVGDCLVDNFGALRGAGQTGGWQILWCWHSGRAGTTA